MEEKFFDPMDTNRKVNVKNLTPIDTFVILKERPGETKVPRNGSALFTVGEIMQQCLLSNNLFVGPNRDGKHVALYVTDKDLRIHLGFESEDGKKIQDITNEDSLLKLFEDTNLERFYNNLKDQIITIGEKQILREIIKSGKVNAYDKIEIAKKFLSNEYIPPESLKKPPGRPRKK